MPTAYSSRILTQTERKAWVPKNLDDTFRQVIPNFQAWVIQKMMEEIKKASD